MIYIIWLDYQQDKCIIIYLKLISFIFQSVVTNLQTIMAVITDDPVTLKVNADTLLDHYNRIHPQSDEHTQAYDYLTDVAEFQGGYLVPSDLTRPSCPVLE